MELRKNPMRLEQLMQIAITPIWDGDLISKSETQKLDECGLIRRVNGFNIISENGIILLDKVGAIKH